MQGAQGGSYLEWGPLEGFTWRGQLEGVALDGVP